MKLYLFVCKGNSGRSAMAEYFFNKYSNENKAISAGWQNDEKVFPDTVKLMKEVNIDISNHIPQALTSDLMDKADVIITINKDAYDHIPKQYNQKIIQWEISILSNKSYEEVREIRNLIENKVKLLLNK